MFAACGDYVEARRLHAAVAEQVREFGEVAFERVVCAREEVAQVVREYFARRHSGARAELFHLVPDAVAADRFPGPVGEYRAARYAQAGGVAQEFARERGGEEYAAAFAFEHELRAARARLRL